MRITHPDQTPMTYEEFFRERQDARYGGKGGAKCCFLIAEDSTTDLGESINDLCHLGSKDV